MIGTYAAAGVFENAGVTVLSRSNVLWLSLFLKMKLLIFRHFH